ncbi:MAG: AbrB/MazE/SpoVT family DNA-binding domain-containing protein [Verrucomicrobia bacterium]|jgi:antitoxin VapB|nr:AbrB/MazE/SpoVT family DNA-binding domain-containing protein [Verrucomicrobiota bacterium]MBT7069179.1 AbrB/MazE/SpoVT family DNA-binding domain-containing protein [Verrucomicrobiota bacterium]MBT7699613.1 AbrB/MazE/SpoVT family DNA-binding domain-containing protein [Verrucomicrobiota bacterium]
MITAKVFTSGRSQAVRLPKRYRFHSREVNVQPTADGLLLTEKEPWTLFDEGVSELPADFLAERNQPPLEDRGF